jgi:hypothetical protein
LTESEYSVTSKRIFPWQNILYQRQNIPSLSQLGQIGFLANSVIFWPVFGRVKLVPSIFNHSGRNRGVRFVKQHTEVTVLALLSIKVRVLTISGVHL